MSTNRWLDELKKIQEDIGPAMESTGKEAYIPTTIETYALFWYLFKMDRLIAIADGVEFNGSGGFSYYYCPVCKCPLSKKFEGAPTVYDLLGHDNDCLYSDEWEPNGEDV